MHLRVAKRDCLPPRGWGAPAELLDAAEFIYISVQRLPIQPRGFL